MLNKKFLEQPPSKKYLIKKKTKTLSLFKNCLDPKDILPKKIGTKNLKIIGKYQKMSQKKDFR